MAVDYAGIAVEVAAAFEEVSQGTVILTRMVYGDPDPATPWIPGEPAEAEYTLDAIASAVTVDQANAKYIDGTTITMADIVVTCSATATHTATDGVPVAPVVVPITPAMTDTLSVDGQVRAIKKILQVPAAGIPVMFKLFVAG